MSTATVTSKGQVTIPAEIRVRYGIEAGHQLVFFPRGDGTFGVRIRRSRRGAARGAAADPAFAALEQDQLIDEVGRAVGEGVAERFETGGAHDKDQS